MGNITINCHYPLNSINICINITFNTMLKESTVPKLALELLKTTEQYYVEHQKLSNEILTQLHSLFGNTLQLATELLENCRITKYETIDKSRNVHKIGNSLERYTIYNNINFCHCRAFQSQVLEDKTSLTCRHVLAITLNQIMNTVSVKVETVSDSQLVEFLNEQLSHINE